MIPLTLREPVTPAPGLTPRYPLTAVAPVLVTVVAARTANLAAEPSGTGAWAAVTSWRTNITPTARPMTKYFFIIASPWFLFNSDAFW
jgi:hypothetical protein